MKKFAVVQNSIVTNILIAESQEIAEQVTGQTCVEYTDSNPAVRGLSYNNETFEQPIIPEPEAPVTE
jgi:hypothetical protein